jgi:hypothetical protein
MYQRQQRIDDNKAIATEITRGLYSKLATMPDALATTHHGEPANRVTRYDRESILVMIARPSRGGGLAIVQRRPKSAVLVAFINWPASSF